MNVRPRLLVCTSVCAGLVILFCATTATATTFCVKPGGGGGCLATITLALTGATAGDTIRVAQGTYTENVDLSKNVTLEGGWNTAFTQRDPTLFVSTIQPADVTQSVVSTFGSSGNPASSTPVLDGFTIRGGRADQGFNHGGGIRLRFTHATVRRCTVTDNRAYLLGGGIWVQGGAPRLEDNRVDHNVVAEGTGTGGGIMLENPDGAVLARNVVTDNVVEDPSSSGGGIGIQSGSVLLTDNTVTNNVAASTGSSGRGGGISIELGAGLTVRGGSITDNRSGLGCQGYGGGMFVTDTATAIIENIRFRDNCATFGGGGIYFYNIGQYVVAGSLFAGNNGGGNGQAILDDSASGDVMLRLNTFAGSGSGTGINVPADLTFVDNIVTGFATGIGAPPGVVAEYNVFFNNTANTLGFTLDPDLNLFVDPLLDANYRLGAGSPAIDAGIATSGPFVDLDGQTRPADGGSNRYRFDIGSDEAPGEGPDVADLDRGNADLVVNGTGNPDSDQNTDWIGYSVIGADVTGDAGADLVIAAEDYAQDFDNDIFANGHVFGIRHFGTRRTGTLNLLDEPADFELASVLNNWHFGEGFGSGDVDADGKGDLVVVAGVQDDGDDDIIPTVIVFSGGPGLAGEIVVDSDEPGAFSMRGQSGNGGNLGGWNGNGLGVGDLNGDGIADLVAAEAGAQTPGGTSTTPPGAAHVVFGELNLGGELDLAATPADVTVVGADVNHPLRAAAVGRLDIGTQADLVVRTGVTAHVLFGPLAPGVRNLATPANVTVTGLGDPGEFFDQAAVGDATGDGWNDLVITSGDGNAATRILVFAGPFTNGQTLNAATDATFTLVTESFISALAFGNVLGDVRADLIVGVENARRLYVMSPGAVSSGEASLQEVASMVVAGDTQRHLGWDAHAGDLDGDARPDLLVGTWQIVDPSVSSDDNDADIGRAFVFYGGATPDNCPGVSNPGQADGDGDAVGDDCDDCRLLANGDQRDTNGDGFGNRCDPDLDGNGIVNFSDLGILRSRFFTADADADLDGDGSVNFGDLGIMKAFFFQPPGPGH